jgi:hypothetical protein
MSSMTDRLVERAASAVDPLLTEFRRLKRNSRWYCEWQLLTGARHEPEHFAITERLDAFFTRLNAAPATVQAALLAETDPELCAWAGHPVELQDAA